MKEYLLILFVVGANPAEENAVQATKVTRQQCYAVVELYRDKLPGSPVRASCYPPHTKYSTGGVVPATHSWQQSAGDIWSQPIGQSLTSGPGDDRKAP